MYGTQRQVCYKDRWVIPKLLGLNLKVITFGALLNKRLDFSEMRVMMSLVAHYFICHNFIHLIGALLGSTKANLVRILVSF